MQSGPARMFIRIVIVRDWPFLSIILISCSVAAIVATFQYSVFNSFVRTAANMQQKLGGDFWITAATVECFECPDPISEDYAAIISRYTPDAHYRRVVFGFATWRSPIGKRGNVAIVGVDGMNIPDNGFVVDQSDLGKLDIERGSPLQASEATIADTTLKLHGVVDDMPTFLGSPYIIVAFERGRELLRMDPSSTSYLIGDLPSARTADLEAISKKAAKLFPEIAVLPAADFGRSSSEYWQRRTGSGLAILLAAALASVLMVILLSNGVLRFIQRYHQDLLSLIGHGASERVITRIVIGVSAIIAFTTMIATVIVTPTIMFLMRSSLPWARFVWSDSVVPIITLSAAIFLAMVASRRAIAAYGPEAVFRS